MKIKVSGATNLQLDWLVAKCLVADRHMIGAKVIKKRTGYVVTDAWGKKITFQTWEEGGPIIERERIAVCYEPEWEVPNWGAWRTDIDDRQEIMGETALIAAMRCYVASKLGDEVEIPEELA